MYKRLKTWWHNRRMYVTADPDDSSLTFSKSLCRHLRLDEQEEAKVFVFRITEDGTFGFVLNPVLEQETQLADVQYNDKYNCIGIETLNPTVSRIYYDYRLPMKVLKLPVEVCETNGMTYYKMHKP